MAKAYKCDICKDYCEDVYTIHGISREYSKLKDESVDCCEVCYRDIMLKISYMVECAVDTININIPRSSIHFNDFYKNAYFHTDPEKLGVDFMRDLNQYLKKFYTNATIEIPK